MSDLIPADASAAGLIAAAACLVGGVLLGLLLRSSFGRLARREVPDGDRGWSRFGWGLLKDTALPVAAAGGVWLAAEVLQTGPPVRDIVDRVLQVVVVLAIVLAAARIAGNVVAAVAVARAGASHAGAAQSATIFVNLTRVLVVAIGLLVLLQSLGVSVTPMLTALGVGGLAVALALQDTLANLFAGVQILASKKVQPGDFVRLDTGEEGYVVDVNWRNTSVRQLAGNIIVIPNARLAEAVLTNFHQPMQDMSVLAQVGVAYDSDLDHVERVTIEVGREVMRTVEGAVAGHEPFIRFHTFGDYSIQFSVNLRVSEFRAQYLVLHEFIKQLHRRYQAEGIEIPFPIRTLRTPDPAPPIPAPPIPAPLPAVPVTGDRVDATNGRQSATTVTA